MKPSEILKLKRAEVLQIAEKYGVKNLRVFGSVARGEDDEKSDIDFLADFPRPFTLFKLGGLINELEALWGFKVDIGKEASLKPRAKDNVLREAIPL